MAFKKIKLLDELYNSRLPKIYLKEDELQKPTAFPLKRFLQIGEAGFDYLQDKTEGIYNMYDIDKCPPEFLPHLAKMLGFEFPYDMSDRERRSFLKALPTLYKNKGNKTVFRYLGRVIFGLGSEVDARRFNRDADHDYNYIELKVNVDGDIVGLDKLTDKYKLFAERFRPVNHKINVLIGLYYEDVFNSREWDDYSANDIEILVTDEEFYVTENVAESDKHIIWLTETEIYDATPLDGGDDLTKDFTDEVYDTQPVETEMVSVLKHLDSDSYDSANLADSGEKELLLNYESDAYNGISADLVDDSHIDLTKDAETDSYTAVKLDSAQDTIISLGSVMGNTRPNSRIGKQFLLGRRSSETVLAEY